MCADEASPHLPDGSCASPVPHAIYPTSWAISTTNSNFAAGLNTLRARLDAGA